MYSEEMRVPDWRLAKLLKLSVDEYNSLLHQGLQEFRDMEGRVIEYYIRVSSNNDPELLKKINPDPSNFIRFSPEEVVNMLAII